MYATVDLDGPEIGVKMPLENVTWTPVKMMQNVSIFSKTSSAFVLRELTERAVKMLQIVAWETHVSMEVSAMMLDPI